MKQNKKILNEILEEIPELQSDKKQLSEALFLLEKIKPQEKIDPKFQKKLKQRLQNISAIKTGKTKNFYFFFIPVLSFCFIVVGGYISFGQVDFFHKNNGKLQEHAQPYVVPDGSQLLEEEILFDTKDKTSQGGELESSIDALKVNKVDINHGVNIQIPTVKNIVNQPDLSNDESLDIIATESIQSQKSAESNDNQTGEPILQKSLPIIGKSEILGISEDTNSSNDIDDTPDNGELLELFGNPAESEEAPRTGFMADGMMEDEGSIESIQTFGKQAPVVTFEDFCTNALGEVKTIQKIELCLVKTDVCRKTNFENGVCKWEDLKKKK